MDRTSEYPPPKLIWNGDGENPLAPEPAPAKKPEEHGNLEVLAHTMGGTASRMSAAGGPIPELGQKGIDAVTLINGLAKRDLGGVLEGGVPMAVEAMTHEPMLGQMAGQAVQMVQQIMTGGIRPALSAATGGLISPNPKPEPEFHNPPEENTPEEWARRQADLAKQREQAAAHWAD
jgi:hypothetical protein